MNRLCFMAVCISKLQIKTFPKNKEFESSVKTPFLVTIWVHTPSTRMRVSRHSKPCPGRPAPSMPCGADWGWFDLATAQHQPHRAISKKQKRRIAQTTNLGHSDKRQKASTPPTKTEGRRSRGKYSGRLQVPGAGEKISYTPKTGKN